MNQSSSGRSRRSPSGCVGSSQAGDWWRARDSASVEWRPTDGVVFGGSRQDDAEPDPLRAASMN
jgi:hypothetical protein